LGYPCSSTLLIVASMYRPWLNEGVTTDIFGQSPLLPFMLRPSFHLRSHDIPQTSRRVWSSRRRVPQRAHPNIPLTTTHATTLLSAKPRYRRVGRALCATLLPPIALAFRCPGAGLIGVGAEAESSIPTRLAHVEDRPADKLALYCQAASDFQREALVKSGRRPDGRL
jgi:hypothetical protein